MVYWMYTKLAPTVEMASCGRHYWYATVPVLRLCRLRYGAIKHYSLEAMAAYANVL